MGDFTYIIAYGEIMVGECGRLHSCNLWGVSMNRGSCHLMASSFAGIEISGCPRFLVGEFTTYGSHDEPQKLPP